MKKNTHDLAKIQYSLYVHLLFAFRLLEVLDNICSSELRKICTTRGKILFYILMRAVVLDHGGVIIFENRT